MFLPGILCSVHAMSLLQLDKNLWNLRGIRGHLPEHPCVHIPVYSNLLGGNARARESICVATFLFCFSDGME